MENQPMTNTDMIKNFEEKLGLSRYQMIAKLQVLEALRERFGDEVIEIVEKTTGKNTKDGFASLAVQKGSNSIEDLISVLWAPAITFGMAYTSESTVDGVQMKCTKCAWHEYMKAVDKLAPELNALKWGYHLYCITDPYICEGFNANIGFNRTSTLMEGHECCDHSYYYIQNK